MFGADIIQTDQWVHTRPKTLKIIKLFQANWLINLLQHQIQNMQLLQQDLIGVQVYTKSFFQLQMCKHMGCSMFPLYYTWCPGRGLRSAYHKPLKLNKMVFISFLFSSKGCQLVHTCSCWSCSCWCLTCWSWSHCYCSFSSWWCCTCWCCRSWCCRCWCCSSWCCCCSCWLIWADSSYAVETGGTLAFFCILRENVKILGNYELRNLYSHMLH